MNTNIERIKRVLGVETAKGRIDDDEHDVQKALK